MCFHSIITKLNSYHIDTDNNYQKYIRFSWKIDGKIIYFTFIVVPFSFSSAPFIFTKVMRCLVKSLEKRRDKKFAHLLTTILDSPPPPPPLRLFLFFFNCLFLFKKKKKKKKNIPLMLTAVNIKTKYSEELSNCCFEKQLL